MSPDQQHPTVDPPGYPHHWEADVLLRDGRTARLRPIRPDDAAELVSFYDRVSAESKYLRFFAPYPRLSSSDVERFTVVDYTDRVALVMTVGTDIIAVGRYDRVEDALAEVAFLVEDAHQGRGIAQLLLEHLAEAARERGVTKFVAEVLPQNRTMASVFAEAGYRVHKGIEDGVLAVEFPILPTNTSMGVMERREHRAEGMSMERLLHPGSIVVLGPGERIQALALSLLSGGYRGQVRAVATDDVEVSAVPTAPSLAAIGAAIDLVVAAVPPSGLPAAVIDAAHHGAHALVALTGSPSSDDDAERLVSLARAYGLRAVGPDALGVINTAHPVEMNATPAPMPRAGGAGVFCQSAAVGIGLLNAAGAVELGISSFISTGEFADVTANDVMQYWEDDEATRVCVLSLDSIGNPRKFSRIVRRLTRRKPVIVFSPGRAHRSSHAGDRGGLTRAPAEAIDSMFRQSGVVVAHRRDEMFDIAMLLGRQPLPRGPRVHLVTNSVTLLRQAEQVAHRIGLTMHPGPTLSADADAAEVMAAVEAAMASGTDSVICALTTAFHQRSAEARDELAALAARTRKPLIAVFLDFDRTQWVSQGPDTFGTLPAYDGVADALQALAAAAAYAHWRERDPGAVPLLDHRDDVAKRVVNQVLAASPSGRQLTEEETTTLLHAYGISVVPEYRVDTVEQARRKAAELGWDVVLKATSPQVRGRADMGSVFRHVDDAAELDEAWRNLAALTHAEGLPGGVEDLSAAAPVIQAMMPAGVSLSVESSEDAAFGPMVSLGLEGLASDLLADVVHRVPPLTTVDAAAMVRDLRAAPVLFGSYGGIRAVDVDALEDLLHRVAQLADHLPQLASVRLSPCLVSPQGLYVLRARVDIAPSSDRRDPLARALG